MGRASVNIPAIILIRLHTFPSWGVGAVRRSKYELVRAVI